MTEKKKLKEIKKLADAMYYAAFNLTTDTSLLRKAMNEYHQFIVHEYHKEEPVSEDLEKISYYFACMCHPLKTAYSTTSPNPDVIKAFKAGAKWQEAKDQSTIELAEDHAMLAGMEKMKEEMMAKAIDGYVIEDIEEGNGDFLLSAEYLPKSMGLKDRQKVKVIAIKGED